jgi:hypothetical protein
VHDVQWAPSGECFAVVAGFMPAKTSIFSDACKLLADLGTGPHNLVRFNPQVTRMTAPLLATHTGQPLRSCSMCTASSSHVVHLLSLHAAGAAHGGMCLLPLTLDRLVQPGCLAL